MTLEFSWTDTVEDSLDGSSSPFASRRCLNFFHRSSQIILIWILDYISYRIVYTDVVETFFTLYLIDSLLNRDEDGFDDTDMKPYNQSTIGFSISLDSFYSDLTSEFRSVFFRRTLLFAPRSMRNITFVIVFFCCIN